MSLPADLKMPKKPKKKAKTNGNKRTAAHDFDGARHENDELPNNDLRMHADMIQERAEVDKCVFVSG